MAHKKIPPLLLPKKKEVLLLTGQIKKYYPMDDIPFYGQGRKIPLWEKIIIFVADGLDVLHTKYLSHKKYLCESFKIFFARENQILIKKRILTSVKLTLDRIRARYLKHGNDKHNSFETRYAYPNTLPNKIDTIVKIVFYTLIILFYLIDSTQLSVPLSWVDELNFTYKFLIAIKFILDLACYEVRLHSSMAKQNVNEFKQYGRALLPILIEVLAIGVCSAVFVLTILTFSLYPNSYMDIRLRPYSKSSLF